MDQGRMRGARRGRQSHEGRQDGRLPIDYEAVAAVGRQYPGRAQGDGKMTKPQTVTFGEIMLRLTPPGFERYLQTPNFNATFGGGEANVAVALATLGLKAAYVTVLPENNP